MSSLNPALFHKKITAAGILIATGIVFGDIGTSPLYTLNAVFHDRVNLISTSPFTSRHVVGFPKPDQLLIKRNINMLTLILFLAALICFYLFYKSIDFFENI